MSTLDIIVPVFNEEDCLDEILRRLTGVRDSLKASLDVSFLFVNDGSKDNTLEVLKKNDFNYIDGFCNLGLFGAVQTGFKLAIKENYDIVIQFDGDGQHSAKYIAPLVKEIEKGNNIVIGSRFVDEKKPFTARMMGSRLIAGAIKLMTGKTITDPTSGFRAYDRACIKDYAGEMNNPPEPDTLVYMLRKQRKIKEIQVQMSDREFGESYLNLVNTIKYMSRMMVSIFLIQPFRKVK